MRFASFAITISLALAVTASVSKAQNREADPRAATLMAEGKAALAAGQPQKAIDYFEAALVVDPGYTPLLVELGNASRRDGMQGKAIAYYREALRREPENLAAISGEGEAMVEKGAVEKARRNLAQLERLCGSGCAETRKLAMAIQRGRQAPVLRAEAVLPDAQISQN